MDAIVYTTRNSYWSRDYITGIRLLLNRVERDNGDLEREITGYSTFLVDCWRPFLSSLQSQTNEAGSVSSSASVLLSGFIDSLGKSRMDSVKGDCIDPLTSLLKDNAKLYNEMEEDLLLLYQAYNTDLKSCKESYFECENRANLLQVSFNSIDNLNKPISLVEEDGPDNKTTKYGLEEEEEEEEEVIKEFKTPRLLPHITFPLKLDERLNFNDEQDFIDFILMLKNKVPIQKRLIPLPNLPNETFTGAVLLKKLSKVDSKLDTSLFNMNSLGQKLLSLKIIYEYSAVRSTSMYLQSLTNSNSASQEIFNEDNYYFWNTDLFDITDNSKEENAISESKHNKYGSLMQNNEENNNTDNHNNNNKNANISSSISSWIRKVSGTTAVEDDDFDNFQTKSQNIMKSQNELDRTIGQLRVWQERFFQRSNKLEYSKVQLEKSFFNYCKKYESVKSKINKSIENSSKLFKFKLTDISKLELPSIQNRKEDKVDSLPVGFFLRDNVIPYTKWNVDESSKRIDFSESMFGATKINADTVNAVEVLLEIIECYKSELKLTNEQYISMWQNNIDIVRVTNLKRDFLRIFNETSNNLHINTEVMNKFRNDFVSTSRMTMNNCIDLLKLFLLELQEGVIPSSLYEDIMDSDGKNSDDDPWLLKLSKEKLEMIQALSNHLNLLGRDSILLFNKNTDIPFYHYFYRGQRIHGNPVHNVAKLSKIVYDILIKNASELGKALKQKSEVANSDIPKIIVAEDGTKHSDVARVNNGTGSGIFDQSTAPYLKHRRSASASVLLNGIKRYGSEINSEKDEDFVPLPFKTTSTPGSPSPSPTKQKQKRRSGINLLTPAHDVLEVVSS